MRFFSRKEFVRVAVDRLQPGMHISVAERWLDHPFLLNEFTLEDARQIEILRALGMTDVLWCPDLSSTPPLAAAPAAAAPVPVAAGADGTLLAAARAEQAAAQASAQIRRARLNRGHHAHRAAMRTVRDAFETLWISPVMAAGRLEPLIVDMCATFNGLAAASLLLIAEQGDSNPYIHALNVTLLGMTLGRSSGLSPDGLREIALGALFHDVGLQKIQSSVRMKTEAERSPAEETLYRHHPAYGLQMTANLPGFGADAQAIIGLHHAHYDGSGYPAGRGGEDLPLPARIVAIANRYDNLSNPRRRSQAITPAEALSRMYALESAHFDPVLLARFVKTLGVYPPGSIVELSNGAVGMVMTVNPADTLRPTVVLWAADTTPDTAPLLDLAELPLLSLVRTLRPADLPEDVQAFFHTGSRLAYFLMSSDPDAPPA